MRFEQPTKKTERAWRKWVASRPENVRKVAERFDPWTLYRMKTTGQRCMLYSFNEEDDGRVTLTVDVTGHFNLHDFDKQVFGCSPDNFEECDLPAPGEPLGTILTNDKAIAAYVDVIRPFVLAGRKREGK